MHAVAYARHDLGGRPQPLRQILENQRDRKVGIGVAARSETNKVARESVERQRQIRGVARRRRKRGWEAWRRTRGVKQEGGNVVSCEVDAK